jgi:hypothetical protein
MHATFLTIHIVAGSTGLILGPVAMLAAKRRGRHTRVGELYFWVYVALVASAFALAALDWDRLWFLVPIGAFSFGFALLGYLTVKLRRSNWLPLHVTGQGGSYIAMTTALLVVNLGTGAALAWIAPTIVGSPMIAYVNTQIALGRRPKGRPDLARALPSGARTGPAPVPGGGPPAR